MDKVEEVLSEDDESESESESDAFYEDFISDTLSEPKYRMLCKVEKAYAEDAFNLTGLCSRFDFDLKSLFSIIVDKYGSSLIFCCCTILGY
jgi:hypothetical protein